MNHLMSMMTLQRQTLQSWQLSMMLSQWWQYQVTNIHTNTHALTDAHTQSLHLAHQPARSLAQLYREVEYLSILRGHCLNALRHYIQTSILYLLYFTLVFIIVCIIAPNYVKLPQLCRCFLKTSPPLEIQLISTEIGLHFKTWRSFRNAYIIVGNST